MSVQVSRFITDIMPSSCDLRPAGRSNSNMRVHLACVCALGAACATNPSPKLPSAARKPTDATLAHVISRTTFGARPGDVDRVRAAGIAAYLEAQLHPEHLLDEGLDGRLEPLR